MGLSELKLAHILRASFSLQRGNPLGARKCLPTVVSMNGSCSRDTINKLPARDLPLSFMMNLPVVLRITHTIGGGSKNLPLEGAVTTTLPAQAISRMMVSLVVLKLNPKCRS